MKKILLFILVSFGVQQLNAQLAVNINYTDVTCFASCNGSATAIPSGGVAPYSYIWNNAATTQTITGLCVGAYTVTVTDATLATANMAVTINQPLALTVTGSTVSANCNNPNGSATAIVNGGVGPYTYSWSSGHTTVTATGLMPGTYTCNVIDASGCTSTLTVTVGNISMTISAAVTNCSCYGVCDGAITSSITGGTPPYTYIWYPNSSNVAPNASNLCAGPYSVTITDMNGCTVGTPVSITEPPAPTVTYTSIEAGCNMPDGSATVYPIGNAPFTYNWLPMNVTTQTASNIAAGTYTVDITDNSGCMVQATVTVTDSCDYVWPGDANDDAVADNLDILDIGIANGATGTTRANATLNWIGQPSAAWGQTLLSGTDYKFVDCNGDGIIDPADTNAVIQNFGFTHNNRQGGIPVYDASLPDLSITMGQNILASSSTGTMTVAFGSSSIPVADFYGLAFTLNFDPAQIDASSFRMNQNGTWMGTPGNDLMGVVLNAGNGTGSVQIAITRLDHMNATGFGNIVNLGFMTTGNLVGTGNTQNVNFTISNVTVISANETPQTVNTIGDSVLVADPVLTGISAAENNQQLSAYPNPFTESVQIMLPASAKGKICEVILTDATGRIVLSRKTNGVESIQLERGTLERGIYFCSIRMEGQTTGNTKLVVN